MKEKRGLSSEAAKTLLKKHGKNEIEEISKISIIQILFRQVKKNFIIYLLLGAMVISFVVGKNVTAYTILAVIILVVSSGFVQEYKAEKSINALKGMLTPVSIVVRDNEEQEILSTELVPGDILILRNGEKIPADCIVIEEKDLFVDESILTGESKEVRKISVKNPESENYNDENLLFMGSFIVNGKCIARVANTGMKTKFGKIAKMISVAEKELPLQKKINKIAKYMAIIAIVVSLLTGAIILLETEQISKDVLINILILVIALSVSAFPEGFPVVLITTLSIGIYKMAKKNAIVNRMSIIETLGETTVICSDKTGTITKGEMTAREIYLHNKFYTISGAGYEAEGNFQEDKKIIDVKKEKVLNFLLKASVLCNDSIIRRTGEDNIYTIIGSPTEAALKIMAAKAGIFEEDITHQRINEIPFSSEKKVMYVLCKENREKILYAKGAFEALFEKCKFIQNKDGIFRILERDKEKIIKEHERMNSKTLRTLAVAYKKIKYEKEDFENDLIFLGLVGMEGPPREEVKDAVRVCKKAGISVKMITGDSKEIALAIAKQIGIYGKVVTGYELDKMSDTNLEKIVKEIVIFARVKPEHKLRIVKALKQNNEIVTMTGDGVNDAPALKEAHIGVAMGKNGTDVSRAVADLTLKDDNFATIVDAIREGRTIFKNIRKFVTYQLSCNYAELSILFVGVLLSPILGWPVPLLLALHILFMNLVTDNLPAITLGFNPSSDDIMDEEPHRKSEILTKNLFILLGFAGTIMALFTLMVFYITYSLFNQPIEYARTSALVTLILVEIAGAFNFRSFRKSVLTRTPFVNKYLFVASVISIIATLLIIYTPLNKIFETAPIGINGWVVAICSALALAAVFDFLKKINRKKKFWKEE